MALLNRLQHCIPSILGIIGKTVSKEEVLSRGRLPSAESTLCPPQLHRAGHVARTEGVLMPKAGCSASSRNEKAILVLPRRATKTR